MKNFKIYNASAGSGKTFTLVKEFLKLLFVEDSYFYFTHILAITFTNKAASEMKERILSALQELAGFAEETAVTGVILPEIMAQSKLTKQEIGKRAKLIFFTILHRYDDFPISTIDSFVQKIIRQFAKDLHLSMNFEVELETEILIEHVIDLLISEVGVNKELTKIVIDYLHFKDRSGKSTNIVQDLQSFGKVLLKEETIHNVEELSKISSAELDSSFGRIHKYLKEYEEKITVVAKNAIDLMQVNGIDPIEDFPYKKNGIGGYFQKIATHDLSKIIPNSYGLKALNEDKWYTASKAENIKMAIEEIKGDLILFYQEIIEDYENYRNLKLVSHYAYPMRLLKVIYRLMEDYKLEENLLPITDFNPLINSIVRDSEVPFIYEKLAVYYKHFLIDEFQDTSILQWQNLLPLLTHSLSEGKLNMLVGDGKQAIYRWRGGEVQQFIKLPEIYQKNSDVHLLFERTLKHSYDKKQLIVNRRSKKTIVDFNIELFHFLKNFLNSGFETIYDGLSEEEASNKEEGYVEINFLDDSIVDKDKAYMDEVYRILQENLEKDYSLKDMAILFHKNDDAAMVGKYLMEKGIAVLSNESLLLVASLEVRFMISLSYCLLHRDSAIYSAEMLYYAKQLNLLEETENELFIHANEKANTYIEFWFGDYSQLSLFLQLPLYEYYEYIFRKFFSTEDNHLYLSFFMENVFSQSRKKKTDLVSFLEWWEKKKNKLSIVIPEGIDAVSIMTIHKAKGLEFPIVIYPMANKAVRYGGDIWIDDFENEITKPVKNFLVKISDFAMKDTSFEHLSVLEKNQSFLDLINALYVVLTRPQDKLYILSEFKDRNNKKSVQSFLTEFLKTREGYEEEKIQYQFGENINNSRPISPIQENSLYGKKFISNDWKPRLHLRLENEKDSSEERVFGNLVHKLLSEINSVDDIQKVVRRSMGRGEIKNEERKVWEKRLLDYIQHPKLAPFFLMENQFYSEKTILFQAKTYRPDRVYIKDKQLTIIDFKTGQFSESHKKQVSEYAGLLQKMGYDNIRKILVYLSSDVEMVEFV